VLEMGGPSSSTFHSLTSQNRVRSVLCSSLEVTCQGSDLHNIPIIPFICRWNRCVIPLPAMLLLTFGFDFKNSAHVTRCKKSINYTLEVTRSPVVVSDNQTGCKMLSSEDASLKA